MAERRVVVVAAVVLACARADALRSDPQRVGDEPVPCRPTAEICGAAAALCGAVHDDCAGDVHCGDCGERATSPPSWHAGPPLPVEGDPVRAATIPGGGTYFLVGRSPPALVSLDAEGRWKARAQLPFALYAPSVVAAAGRLYVIGGASPLGDPSRFTWTYSPAADRWSAATATIALARTHAAAAALADGAFVLAGGVATRERPSDSADRLDPTSGSWGLLPPLSGTRDSHALVALPGGDLLAFGGECCNGRVPDPELATAERLSPGGVWRASPSLSVPRRGVAAAVGADARVYAIAGGHSGDRGVASVEAFDLDLDRWTPVAPLRAPRRHATAAALDDGRVIVAGGLDGRTGEVLTTTEIYGPSLTVARSGSALHVTGDNFAARAAVYLYLDTVAPSRFAAHSETDDQGALAPVDLEIDAAAGATSLIAVDTRSRYPARAMIPGP